MNSAANGGLDRVYRNIRVQRATEVMPLAVQHLCPLGLWLHADDVRGPQDGEAVGVEVRKLIDQRAGVVGLEDVPVGRGVLVEDLADLNNDIHAGVNFQCIDHSTHYTATTAGCPTCAHQLAAWSRDHWPADSQAARSRAKSPAVS